METVDLPSALDWPGKSAAGGTQVRHPALYHMLDVGAVAERLLARSQIDLSVREALTFLAALHDLGKIGDGFRAMIERGDTQPERHWEVSRAWFAHFDEGALASVLGSDVFVRVPLYDATAGHHGAPPPIRAGSRDPWRDTVRRAGTDAERDARWTIEAFASLFPAASLDALELDLREAEGDWCRAAKPLSWWFNGLLVVADWVGSNADWFEPQEAGPSVEEYWPIARERAKRALEAAGLEGAVPSPVGSRLLVPHPFLTPMQQAAADAPLPGGPTLAVIEDATGAGKTEAALVLAHRMMQAGKADGITFALPTTATANAMFDRMVGAGSLFEGLASLALAHGRAGFDDRFRTIVGREAGEPDALSCSEWFADARRRPLLAHLGVATLDQALLGTLPTRFMALRLYALSRRVLVVDEAHDYDPYTSALLERLLAFQAMLGGSAILMTATLPARARTALEAAFERGRLRPPPEETAEADAYPRLSLRGEGSWAQPVNPVMSTVRRVAVRRLDTLDAALDVVANAAARGAACAFVRNAVDEAVFVVSALRERGVEATLHHARFALCDRLANERALIKTFGKHGTGRAGKVVVGTQVLEQSLDVDFDVMASDLAPVGALIQRAGRLWRHMEMRPRRERPIDGPTLHVLSPDPAFARDANWSRDLLGAGWYVYPPPVQWRTAQVLFDAGAIDAPGGLRALVEAVDEERGELIPDALLAADAEWLGAMRYDRAHAAQNALDHEEGYGGPGTQKVHDDETFPTRLGPEQVTLVLARREADGSLAPWAANEPMPARAWALSEVQIARAKWEASGGVVQDEPAIAAVRRDWKAWRAASHFVCPVGDDGAIGASLLYDRQLGLRVRSPHRRR